MRRALILFLLGCSPATSSMATYVAPPLMALTSTASQKPKWDVEAMPGETSQIPIDVDEGTWISVDVSPDGQDDRLRSAGRSLSTADVGRHGEVAHLRRSLGHAAALLTGR
jgi:hypothetical protein